MQTYDQGKSLGLSAVRIESLVDAIDRHENLPPSSEGVIFQTRHGPAVHYRKSGVVLKIEHPGGGVTSSAVAPRVLSANHLDVLHGGFVHADSRCTVELPTVWSGRLTATGKTIDCRHVEGRAHRLELAFDSPVDVKHLIDSPELAASMTSTELNPRSLTGFVLVIDPSGVASPILGHLSKSTSIQYTRVRDAGAAFDEIKRRAFDLIIAHFDLADPLDLERTIAGLRVAGHNGPITVMTGESNPARLKQAKDAGVSGVLRMPFETKALHTALAGFLEQRSG